MVSYEENVAVPLFLQIEADKIKVKSNRNIEQVHYVEDLNPFIERKLFTVNTGHAALSYIANYLGIELVSDGAKHADVRKDFIAVLEETSVLLEKNGDLIKQRWKLIEIKQSNALKILVL